MTFLKMLLSLLKERKNKLIHVYEKKKLKKRKECINQLSSFIGQVKNKTGK